MLKLSSKNIALIAAFAAIASQAVAAPAPALSSVRVTRVASTAGSEAIASGQSLTTTDHTGQSLKITVREIGYGGNRIAKMNGSSVGNAVTTTFLCGSTSSPTTCSSGQTIIGFDLVYDASGFNNSSGSFTFQSTGTSGGGTKSTSINIK